ncbi:hypothetical protein CYMTET_48557 [Cymbomonas tetramitiformis]|uniref:Calmodulin-lysine N-methyltransferase n=1 Tax=Cymbomonas tetramitiformis TaxID=36881 RepID=A0AAE0BS61_9CHLO|nr:hypothetical protein CYMTET_48557 [Cymbomonas tetramitiformis]
MASALEQTFVFHTSYPIRELFVTIPSLRQGHTQEDLISTRIWRSSLLLSAYMVGQEIHCKPTSTQGLSRPPACRFPRRLYDATGIAGEARGRFHSLGTNLAWGKDVLELGCGRALPGLLAAQCGSTRVILTDCDHRALDMLRPTIDVQLQLEDHGPTEAMYMLWEEDQKLLEDATEEGFSGSTRHWSNSHTGTSAKIPDDDTFGLILCSDVLYFAKQELPLICTLKRRLHPEGSILFVLPERGNSGITNRFPQMLRDAGFHVFQDIGPFDWEKLQEEHVLGYTAEQDQEDKDSPLLGRTDHESGKVHFLIARWRRDDDEV